MDGDRSVVTNPVFVTVILNMLVSYRGTNCVGHLNTPTDGKYSNLGFIAHMMGSLS